jgi:hypothetical protein
VDDEASLAGGAGQAFVIGDQNAQVGSNRENRGQVHRMQRAQLPRIQLSGAIQQGLIESDQANGAEESPRCTHRPS